jgi:hypothetical protein
MCSVNKTTGFVVRITYSFSDCSLADTLRGIGSKGPHEILTRTDSFIKELPPPKN